MSGQEDLVEPGAGPSPEVRPGAAAAVEPLAAPADAPALPGLARNATAQFVARVAASLSQALALLLVARALGPVEYGRYALVATLAVMVTPVADWGLSLLATRTVAGDGRDRETVLRNMLGVRLVLAGVALLAVVVLGFASSDRAAVHLGALIAGFSFVPLCWMGVAQVQAQLALRLEGVAWASLVAGLGGLAWVVVALRADAGVPLLAAGLVLSAVLSAVASVALTPGRVPLAPRADLALWRELLRESTPLAVTYAFVSVYFYAALGLLSRLGSPSEVGLYDAAYRFMLIAVLLSPALVSSSYAVLSRLAAQDRDAFGRVARELLSITALLMPLPLILMLADADGLVALLYGDRFADAAPVLRMLAPAVAVAIASGVVAPLLVALGEERAMLWITLAAAVFSVAANVVVIPSGGAVGAAAVTVATELLVCGPAMVLLARRGAVRLDVAQLARTALAGALAVAVALLLPTHVLLRASTGAVVYVALLLAAGALGRRQLEITRSPERASAQ